ncbi:protein ACCUMULATION AND REPLICATION OF CHLOROPLASTS 3, chloroplastic isoform X2 [Salvia miltiorrhiza]|uniref:protein ACCUMULATION AND REPLICATION OF CHLOROPLASTS 3, chloroplastic isoform X2 n=1 Tax=Salvia miltiorrhiza TaxID=226208 RepID=UPI0025AC0468|nr:protein ACCUMULATION AND REPLICATION OF CHLOROPLASTS 3, chloroplastic isoform X2 [Salvia miltiorrhiza]
MNLFYPNTTAPHSFSRLSSFPQTTLHKRRSKLFVGCRSNSIKQKLSCNCVTSSCESSSGRSNGGSDTSGECGECLDVIVVGSRKDALLDFCSASPFLSPVLRFWNVLGADSEQVQLQQRFASKDSTPRTVEDFLAWHTSKAVILVASAAYGSDHITALEVLSNVKSGNGFVVGIILMPFSFEGKRRQDEVKDLVGKLQKQTNFCIVLETDTLLENDLVTLDEALRTTNNAVLMAIYTISILLSEKHMKFLSAKDDSIREIQLPEFQEVFENYKEARIGFGAGYNVKASLLRAINDCPFLDLDGVVLCVIASSGAVESSEANNILHTVRVITKCSGKIIVAIVHEPYLEANTIVSAIIVFGYTRKQLAPAPRSGILSSLGQHFPSIFNIFKKQHQQLNNLEKVILSESPHVSNEINPPVIKDMSETNSLDGTADDTVVISGKTLNTFGDAEEEFPSSRSDHSSGEKEVDLLDTNFSSLPYELISEGNYVFKRELFTRGNMGPSHSTESKYGTNFTDAAALVDSVSIYRLPVGVKNLEKLEESPVSSNNKRGAAWRIDDDEKTVPNVSWSGLADVNFNNASIFNKGSSANNSKKQGVLSVRAASMLESERDSQKKWSRVVEMRYRGGKYKGRSQGGLPEGKGRLLLGDGSIYDGMWRYGKRSGLGTFYFNNGDVFQGSWRDDVMHGKGWIYFHTGDRWFVNFWKGKADGEGRFYSKHGDVFFGHFKEGWRHGHFLRINVDGTRAEELWEEGVLVSETQLDPNEDG